MQQNTILQQFQMARLGVESRPSRYIEIRISADAGAQAPVEFTKLAGAKLVRIHHDMATFLIDVNRLDIIVINGGREGCILDFWIDKNRMQVEAADDESLGSHAPDHV